MNCRTCQQLHSHTYPPALAGHQPSHDRTPATPMHHQMGLTLALALASTAAAGGQSTQRTNVVLMLADDQGWGDVGYNKYSYQHDSYKYKWTSNPPRLFLAHMPASLAYAHQGLAPRRAGPVLTRKSMVRSTGHRIWTRWPLLIRRSCSIVSTQALASAPRTSHSLPLPPVPAEPHTHATITSCAVCSVLHALKACITT